jgi:ribosome-associated protein
LAGSRAAPGSVLKEDGLAEGRTRRASPKGADGPDSRDLARLAARAAVEKQASDVLVLDVRDLITITDYFVIASGSSERQVKTVVEEIEKVLKEAGVKPVREEGDSKTGWMLLDYVDLVVHVFSDEQRDYYRLERLWRDAPVVDAEATAEASSG